MKVRTGKDYQVAEWIKVEPARSGREILGLVSQASSVVEQGSFFTMSDSDYVTWEANEYDSEGNKQQISGRPGVVRGCIDQPLPFYDIEVVVQDEEGNNSPGVDLEKNYSSFGIGSTSVIAGNNSQDRDISRLEAAVKNKLRKK